MAPLSLTASLVFEQSYGGVEGDSASAAELSRCFRRWRMRRSGSRFAVTGSVDQQGKIQAIGGVNEKIEGFFDICQRRGLTGEQGVLIPAANVQHLMLRHDVVEAAARGALLGHSHRYDRSGHRTADGVPAGLPDATGGYAEGTINRRISARLAAFAQRAIAAAGPRPARPTRHGARDDHD